MHGKPWKSGHAAIVVLLALLAAGPGVADWKIYVAPDLGISGAMTDTDGAVSAPPGFPLSGEDDDGSPLLALAVGLEVPMDELFPREWLMGARLPKWPVRFEVEGAGLREYEFRTAGGGPDVLFTTLTTESLFVNTWVDIPMTSAYQPIQFLLGLGRQPRVRQVLDPMSLYLGIGIGVGFSDFDGTSNAIDATDGVIDFAWNTGMGLNYQLTDRVALSGGYRYVGLGPQSITLTGPVNGGDDVEFDTHIHEFRFQVRVRVYEFLSPWR